MKDAAGPFDRAILAANGRRMHDEARADAQAALIELGARAARTQDALDAAQRAAVRPLWERHKLALTTRALVRVRRALDRRTQPATAAGR